MGATEIPVVVKRRVEPDTLVLVPHRYRLFVCPLDADLAVVDSMRLSTDVDEPADLVEVLLHGEGQAVTWLRELLQNCSVA